MCRLPQAQSAFCFLLSASERGNALARPHARPNLTLGATQTTRVLPCVAAQRRTAAYEVPALEPTQRVGYFVASHGALRGPEAS